MAAVQDTNNEPPLEISVLFVCLGNICTKLCPYCIVANMTGRSPMAEAVFTYLTDAWSQNASGDRPTIHIDSAGTGAYHTGADPDSRTMATLQDHGITKFRHAARQVKTQDFERFDYIIAMDRSNLRELKRKARQAKNADGAEEKVSLFGSWEDSSKVNGGSEIDDPYYGGDEGFEAAFEQCVRFSKGWMKTILGADAAIDRKGNVVVKTVDDE